MAKAIILMGIKHCGKSTQAALLSDFFKVPCFDTDDLILEMTGKSPRELFTQSGEEAFKTAEKNACLELNPGWKNARLMLSVSSVPVWLPAVESAIILLQLKF